jgi:hypothetical protein
MRRFLSLIVVAASMLAVAPSRAQEAPPAPPPSSVSRIVHAGTLVHVVMVDAVSSKTAKRDDMFTLRLVEPIMAGDQILVPAGPTGEGQVVDAGRGGFGGKQGKLVLAARNLSVDGQRIALNGMTFGVGGKDTSGDVLAVSLIPYVGLASLFMTGGDIDVPAGARATAKVAVDFVAPAPPTPSPKSGAPSPASEITSGRTP